MVTLAMLLGNTWVNVASGLYIGMLVAVWIEFFVRGAEHPGR